LPAISTTAAAPGSIEALAIVAMEAGIDAQRIYSGCFAAGRHLSERVLEEGAAEVKAELIVMTSHRRPMRTFSSAPTRQRWSALRQMLGWLVVRH